MDGFLFELIILFEENKKKIVFYNVVKVP